MERQTATVAVIFWWGSALAPRTQDTTATSVAFPCLPTCFFLDVIKKIHDQNTSLSIYPKKKKKLARETYIFYDQNGSKLQVHANILAVWIEDRAPGYQLASYTLLGPPMLWESRVIPWPSGSPIMYRTNLSYRVEKIFFSQSPHPT